LEDADTQNEKDQVTSFRINVDRRKQSIIELHEPWGNIKRISSSDAPYSEKKIGFENDCTIVAFFYVFA
jgi:hypothetical protein